MVFVVVRLCLSQLQAAVLLLHRRATKCGVQAKRRVGTQLWGRLLSYRPIA